MALCKQLYLNIPVKHARLDASPSKFLFLCKQLLLTASNSWYGLINWLIVSFHKFGGHNILVKCARLDASPSKFLFLSKILTHTYSKDWSMVIVEGPLNIFLHIVPFLLIYLILSIFVLNCIQFFTFSKIM